MFGLFRPAGKIEIQTDKTAYSFGEAIKVKVKLQMDAPKKAKALRLTFYATREVPYTETVRDANGRTHVSHHTRTDTFYSFNTDMDGEHEYSGAKEYEAELKVPPQQAEPKLPGGILGQIAGAAMAGSNIGAGPLKWRIKASLDIPLAGDVWKETQIQVG